MRKPAMLRTMHLSIGIVGLLFSASFDLLRGQSIQFGLQQFAGLTISAIIILAGIIDLLPWKKKNMLWVLCLLYLGGILFMGLYPKLTSPPQSGLLLGLVAYSLRDFIINVLGFAPMGFLAMALLLEIRTADRLQALGRVTAFCLFISLTIEILQYFLPGRVSSLYDLLANTLGAFGGATLGYLEHRRSARVR